MSAHPDPLAEFRRLVTHRARQSSVRWDDSRRLIEPSAFSNTMTHLLRLAHEMEATSPVRAQLCLALRPGTARAQDLDSAPLKTLTGMPPAKALRALCVYFDLVPHPGARWPVPQMTGATVERVIRQMANPFDLLYEAEVASVLELGAGDLSFAGELADHYGPSLKQRHRELILHCLDRLHPDSKLGGPLHPGPARLQQLRTALGPSFQFYGNQDMSDLRALDDRGRLAARYTIVTCWAPATPTFAYEPARLSATVIADDLRRTKGSSRSIRYGGEPALEVRQGDRALLFPPWKFDIRGPLVLLRLIARRGALGVLGAVDTQVFWEILSQLVDDPRYRPADVPFTAQNRPEIFGDLYRRLDRLAIGESLELAELTPLRTGLSDSEPASPDGAPPLSFRSVRIRRGATFAGMPASSTARSFTSMVEEAPPWFLMLVPA